MGNSSSHTHEPLERGFTRGGKFGDVKSSKAASFRFSKKSPKNMERLRRSFRDSFRRRKDRVPESSKPHQWQSDEQAVRSNTCSFAVKYLGCVEVFDSRGMHICEEALKVLRESKRRPVRGLLHVSGDGLRVVDDDTKGLIVDQTIEKVSFCAPDRNHERGFSYICRDGTTRRWMLHGFLACRDSGERLSHAVGCAFAVCLERKQRRDKECGVTMTFDSKNSTFTRQGSFRQQTMTERLAANERGIDTPSAFIAPQPPSQNSNAAKPYNPFAIERPHATPSMLERQGSFRAFSTIGEQSPFKRQMSLRINDLPSNAERQKAYLALSNVNVQRNVSPIPEISPTHNGQKMSVDTVSQLCQELSQGLSLLTQNDQDMDIDDLNFNNTMSINQNILAAEKNHAMTSAASPITAPSTPIQYKSSPSNGYSSKTTTPPTAEVSPQTITAISPTTPITSTPISSLADVKTPSPIVSTPTSTRTASSLDSPLPKPDQWLGQIVKSSTTSPTSSAIRRPPTLSVAGRTKSLAVTGSSSGGEDPFDSEWAIGVAKPVQIHHTNPFISPPKPPAQSFQVQL